MSINWANYLFHTNFTAERDTLATIPVGEVSDVTALMLAGILANIDNGEGKALWSENVESKAWSTAGCKVIYNGLNSTSLPTKSKMKYVLTLEFPSDSTAPVGRIYLQYNDAPVPVEA